MPIRIQRDKENSGYSPRRTVPGSGGGGGGGGLVRLIPVLLGLFGRNPKMLLILVVAGALFYFLGGKGCMGLPDNNPTSEAGMLATGAEFDLAKYSATEIYEPLADNIRNPLPEKISLLEYAPSRLNQGQQGSCVAWASAYAARTILEARETGESPNSVRFSPSFLYNQIALENCQGAYLPEAMKVMKGQGLARFEDFPYTDRSCDEKPEPYEIKKASDYKIDGYQRLTNGDDPKSVDMLAIKQNLAQGAPVVIGMMVGGSFMQPMLGQEKWLPEDRDYDMPGFGGHAMCVIGYDDYAFAQNMGGFQIMNSWGEEWGNRGIAWVSYQDFQHFVKEAYGLYPMGDARSPSTQKLKASFGIVLNETDENVPFVKIDEMTFSTSRKFRSNELFKIQATNSIPCYTYIFGMETDGSTYTLFPYTEKHSPYCGITGTRLFPRDHSLYPDEKGSKDYFAIVVSSEPIDFKAFEKGMNEAVGSSFKEKLKSMTGEGNYQSEGGKTISIDLDFGTEKLAGIIVEVGK